MGFFALFNCVLNRLSYADRLGFVPVVHYPNTVLYYEDSLANTISNVFEYYFVPVSSVEYKNALQAKNLVISKEADSQFLLQYKPGYLLNESGIVRLSKMWKKYIHFSEETKLKLNRDIQLILVDKKILGVHVRGTDYKCKNKNHPVAVPVQEYINEVKKYINREDYSYIFIATDEEDVISEFENQFDKEILLFYKDVIRSQDGTPIHKSDCIREMHKYLLGYEVLRDMVTLAHCNGFIAGKSQVSLSVRIYNKTLEKEFDNLSILDNGFYF